MATISYLGNFPFCATPAQPWDGIHRSLFVMGDGRTYPSQLNGGTLPPPFIPNLSKNYGPVFGQGTLHPVGFTLEEMTELYWRIAVWEVTMTILPNQGPAKATITAPYFAAGYLTQEYLYNGLVLDDEGNVIDSPDPVLEQYDFFANGLNEKKLVCGGALGFSGSLEVVSGWEFSTGLLWADQNFDFESPPQTRFFQPTGEIIIAEDIPNLMPMNSLLIELNGDVAGYFQVDGPWSASMFGPFFVITDYDNWILGNMPKILRDEDTGLFYPQIWIRNEAFPVGGGGTQIGVSSARWQDFGSSGPSQFDFVQSTVNILGKEINLYSNNQPDNSTFFTMTPKYWWPYDPNDGGGPTYDVSTGERLR